MEKIKVNMNINVQMKFKLTKYGKEILKNYYEELKISDYQIPSETEELNMAMWEIAQIFGKYLYMGNTKIPFVDNKVEIELNKDMNGIIKIVV